DAERAVQALGEYLMLGRRARIRREDDHLPPGAVGYENIAVRRNSNDAWLLQISGKHLHLEAFRDLRHRSLRRGNHLCHVLEIRGFRIVLRVARRWQVFGRDVAPDARRIRLPCAEGILAGKDILCAGWRQRSQDKWQAQKKGRSAHGESPSGESFIRQDTNPAPSALVPPPNFRWRPSRPS